MCDPTFAYKTEMLLAYDLSGIGVKTSYLWMQKVIFVIYSDKILGYTVTFFIFVKSNIFWSFICFDMSRHTCSYLCYAGRLFKKISSWSNRKIQVVLQNVALI